MRKLVLGVTGGIGAGKSMVLKILKEEYQAYVIEADAVGRRLEERGQPGFAAVVREFGDGILGSDGEIDRGKLSKLVFSDADALERLNGLLHPMIYEAIRSEIRRESERRTSTDQIPHGGKKGDASHPAESGSDRHGGFFVLEAAILFETGFDRCCDYTVYIHAEEETRIARLKKTRGYTREKAAGVIANQLKEEEFRSRADFVVENDGDPEETRHQIRRLMENLIPEAEAFSNV